MRDYSLQPQKTNNVRGRKKKVGSLIRMENGRLGVFVGYCTCASKVCMDIEAARHFSSLYRKGKKKLLNRIILALLNRIELQTR